MSLTLLEQAKKERIGSRRGLPATSEEMELAIAWLKGEIKITQVVRVLSSRAGAKKGQYLGGGIYSKLSQWLLQAYFQGILKLK